MLYFQFGFIPQRFFLLLEEALIMPAVIPLFSSIFLHGGWFHLLSNMLYLWVFGDNIEDRLGHAAYLFFYLATGAVGGLAHAAANADSLLPAIGASGAVAGVLGAYFVFYPHARIFTLIPIFIFITFVELPAMTFLFIWFLLQIFNALLMPGEIFGAQAVAWWAHIGGFASGFIIGLIVMMGRILLRRR